MIAWNKKDFESLVLSIKRALTEIDIHVETTTLEGLFAKSQGFNSVEKYVEALPLVVYGGDCSHTLKLKIKKIVDDDLRKIVPDNLFELVTGNNVDYPLISDYDGFVEFSIDWDSGDVYAPSVYDPLHCYSLPMHKYHQFIRLNSIVHKHDFYSLSEMLLPILKEGMLVKHSRRDEFYEKVDNLCRQFDYACGFSSFEDRTWSHSYYVGPEQDWDIIKHPDLENVISMRDWRDNRAIWAQAYSDDM